MTRTLQVLAGLAAVWLGINLCNSVHDALATAPDVERVISPPSIESIRELSELTVLQVRATEVITSEVSGTTGGTSVAVVVHGDVFLGVDLEQAEFVDIDKEQQHLALSLPTPKVRRAAIDHHTSQMIYTARHGLWRLAVGEAREDELIANAYRVGQQRLQEAAAQTDLTDRAKRHAESVLRRFIDGTGWALTIRWND
jgi:hypothetical protein